MRNKLKTAVLWLLILSFMFSFTAVSAQENAAAAETETVEENKLSDELFDIAKNLEIYTRYDEVDRESLYRSALAELIDKHPELYEQALKAMVSSIDENSAYYNEEESKQLFERLNDEVVGIGVNIISSDGNIIVSQPIPGSPAEKAGIRAGDIIIGADDKDLRGMDFDMALDYVRGKEGTTVNIKILRSGISEPISFSIKREVVASNPISYEELEHGGKKIAKITVHSFTDTVLANFKEALDKADKAKINNILIDVRNNVGGYLDQAVGIADLFLPKGAVITTEDHKIDLFNRKYTASGKGKKYKVVMLINGMSASSSEVLTAALRENGVAQVIGEQSFGKGTVQSLINTPDNGVMKYTTAYYLTPDGNNIHKKGIKPDITVENTEKPVDMSQFGTFTFAKTYNVGDSGTEVKYAKEMLKYLGIFIGEVNGNYDENLKIAVNTYQKITGLFPYGVLDITTQLNLYETLRSAKVEVDDQLQTALECFE